MKNPNGYGQIIKLSGKRRKPYAVRLSAGYKEFFVMPNTADTILLADKIHAKYRAKSNDYMAEASDSTKELLMQKGIQYRHHFVRQYKYLEYFAKSKDAQMYLAKMNQGETMKEHVSITSEPSFKDVYTMYIQFAKSLKKKPSDTTLLSWKCGFNLWSDVHDIRFRSITTQQLQDCLTKHSNLSKTSVGKMITVIKKMYKYAMANQIVATDLSPYLFAEHSDDKKYIHTVFTDDEITKLWNTNTEAAKVVLMLIYTGMRCSEFLQLETANIHPEERYMIGGMKTEAGRNRVIPIHKRIQPILKEFYDKNNKYLYPNSIGGYYDYQRFRDYKWTPFMKELGMNHYTHDCRHTCATKLEAAGISLYHRKLILGHSIKDLTDGTYTHVSHETLISDMDLWL